MLEKLEKFKKTPLGSKYEDATVIYQEDLDKLARQDSAEEEAKIREIKKQAEMHIKASQETLKKINEGIKSDILRTIERIIYSKAFMIALFPFVGALIIVFLTTKYNLPSWVNLIFIGVAGFSLFYYLSRSVKKAVKEFSRTLDTFVRLEAWRMYPDMEKEIKECSAGQQNVFSQNGLDKKQPAQP